MTKLCTAQGVACIAAGVISVGPGVKKVFMATRWWANCLYSIKIAQTEWGPRAGALVDPFGNAALKRQYIL